MTPCPSNGTKKSGEVCLSPKTSRSTIIKKKQAEQEQVLENPEQDTAQEEEVTIRRSARARRAPDQYGKWQDEWSD